jgi:Ankyrin repeats (3 copies)/Ankyrin repeat
LTLLFHHIEFQATATDNILALQKKLRTTSHHGRLADVQRLVEQEGVDINAKGFNNGATAVYHASQNGHFSTVQCLVETKADVNLAQSNGCSPLMIASQEGHVKIMEVLLKAGANPGYHALKGNTALYVAVTHSNIQAAELLLDYGADLFVKNHKGQTALDIGNTQEVKAHLRLYNEVHRLRQQVQLNKNLMLATAFGISSSSSISTHNNNNIIDNATTTTSIRKLQPLLDQVIAENAQLRLDHDAKSKQLDEMAVKLDAVIHVNDALVCKKLDDEHHTVILAENQHHHKTEQLLRKRRKRSDDSDSMDETTTSGVAG